MKHEWTDGPLGNTYMVNQQTACVLWKSPKGEWLPATNSVAIARELHRLAEENKRLRGEA